MKIEKAISQSKPFKSSKSKVVVNLVYTYKWMHDLQSGLFKEYDITMQQFNILRILRGASEPISTAVVRDRMLDRASDASRLVDRLEKKGLVNKNICESDQRKIDVTISDSGLKILLQLDRKINEWQNDTIHLTDKEANQLSDLLDKLRN